MFGNNRSILVLLLILVLALGGCQPATGPEPLPTANTVSIQITPALRWMAPLLNECARRTGQGIVVDERPTRDINPSQAALALRWGAPANLPAFAVEIGSDRLALAAHPSNPLHRLTREALTEIYAAAGKSWESLEPNQNSLSGEIHNWSYASGEDIQQLIDSLALTQPARPEASYLAPDPQALRQAVAADPAALGFVPAQLLDASLKELQVEGLDTSMMTQPILALGLSEPQGSLRQFLGCVQEGVP